MCLALPQTVVMRTVELQVYTCLCCKCICLYVHAGAVQMHVYTYACLWRPEADRGCLSQLLSTIFLQTGSLTEAGAVDCLDWLASKVNEYLGCDG